jgi:hypothetical protein
METRRTTVPMLLGFILGVILTVAGAYMYDSSTGRAPNGLPTTAAGGQPPLVNWDVVSADWNAFTADMREGVANLEHSIKRHTG